MSDDIRKSEAKHNRKRMLKLMPWYKSAIIRLVFLMFIIIVPICILTIVMSSRAISMSENLVSEDVQEALSLNMNQIDNYLQNIGRRLYTVSRSDDNYARMLAGHDDDNASAVELMHAYTRLGSVFSDIQSEYTWAENVFAYFPENGYFVSSNGYQTQENKQMIENEISDSANHDGNMWYVSRLNPRLLIGIYEYKDSYYGAYFNLADLLAEIKLDMSDNIVQFAQKNAGLITDDESLASLDIYSANNISFAGEHYIVLMSESDHSDLVLVDMLSRTQLNRMLPGYMRILFIVSIVFLIAIPILFLGFYKWLIRPVNILMDAIAEVDNGNIDYKIEQKTGTYEFDLLNSNFNSMLGNIKNLKINVYEKELEKKDIKLQYLSQQIQPHFILNAMNIIYSYEPDQYDLIQKMVMCLSKYFRFIVNANKSYVKVKHEMEHIENYLRIQKIRYTDRINYDVYMEPMTQDAIMPPLMIQNLVENVIKYALRDDVPVNIWVKSMYMDGMIQIEIRDTGYGIKPETLELISKFKETKVRQEGLGTGIQNTIERLELFFGEKSSFEASRINDDGGTQVVMSFPAVYEPMQDDE